MGWHDGGGFLGRWVGVTGGTDEATDETDDENPSPFVGTSALGRLIGSVVAGGGGDEAAATATATLLPCVISDGLACASSSAT